MLFLLKNFFSSVIYECTLSSLLLCLWIRPVAITVNILVLSWLLLKWCHNLERHFRVINYAPRGNICTPSGVIHDIYSTGVTYNLLPSSCHYPDIRKGYKDSILTARSFSNERRVLWHWNQKKSSINLLLDIISRDKKKYLSQHSSFTRWWVRRATSRGQWYKTFYGRKLL